jgi:hypothetical protein
MEYNPRENFEKKYNFKGFPTIELVKHALEWGKLYSKELEEQNKQMLDALIEDKKIICRLCERMEPMKAQCLICSWDIQRIQLIESITGKKIEEVL